MCLIGNNGETVCHGDEGSPAIFDFEDRKYLGGITSTDLPKTHDRNTVIIHPNGTQERPTAKFFCGPRTLNEGEVFPVKYVRARFRFDWFLNDYIDGHRVRRQEVHDCLVNPPEWKHKIRTQTYQDFWDNAVSSSRVPQPHSLVMKLAIISLPATFILIFWWWIWPALRAWKLACFVRSSFNDFVYFKFSRKMGYRISRENNDNKY